MKIHKKLMLVTAAIAAVFSGVEAQAQNGFATPYAANDLLLDFRTFVPGTGQGTGPGTTDFTIDLGNINTFVAAHNGQRFQISDFSVVNSGLGTLNNVFWTAAATDGASSNSEIWLSSQRGPSPVALTPDSYQLDRAGSLSQGKPRNGITSVGNGAANGPRLSPTVVSTPDSAAYSYHTFVTDNGNFAYTAGGGANTTGNGYEGVTGSSFSGANSLDFYALPSGTGKGTYLGYFELNSNGSLFWVDDTFVTAAVPEPSTYGVLAGLGLLVVALRNKVKAIA